MLSDFLFAEEGTLNHLPARDCDVLAEVVSRMCLRPAGGGDNSHDVCSREQAIEIKIAVGVGGYCGFVDFQRSEVVHIKVDGPAGEIKFAGTV